MGSIYGCWGHQLAYTLPEWVELERNPPLERPFVLGLKALMSQGEARDFTGVSLNIPIPWHDLLCDQSAPQDVRDSSDVMIPGSSLAADPFQDLFDSLDSVPLPESLTDPFTGHETIAWCLHSGSVVPFALEGIQVSQMFSFRFYFTYHFCSQSHLWNS